MIQVNRSNANFLSGIVSFLTLIAVGSKLMGWVDWSWLSITSVYLIMNVIGILLLTFSVAICYIQGLSDKDTLTHVEALCIGMALWCSSVFMISLKLDGYIDWSWWTVCSPMIAQFIFFLIGLYIIVILKKG